MCSSCRGRPLSREHPAHNMIFLWSRKWGAQITRKHSTIVDKTQIGTLPQFNILESELNQMQKVIPQLWIVSSYRQRWRYDETWTWTKWKFELWGNALTNILSNTEQISWQILSKYLDKYRANIMTNTEQISWQILRKYLDKYGEILGPLLLGDHCHPLHGTATSKLKLLHFWWFENLWIVCEPQC